MISLEADSGTKGPRFAVVFAEQKKPFAQYNGADVRTDGKEWKGGKGRKARAISLKYSLKNFIIFKCSCGVRGVGEGVCWGLRRRDKKTEMVFHIRDTYTFFSWEPFPNPET